MKKTLPRRFFIQLWAIYQMLLLVRMGNARGINFVIPILYSTVYLYLLDIFFTFCSKKYLLNFQIHGCLFNLQIIEHLSGNKTVQRGDKKNYDFSSPKHKQIFFSILEFFGSQPTCIKYTIYIYIYSIHNSYQNIIQEKKTFLH